MRAWIVGAVAVTMAACSGGGHDAALAKARSACAHWAKLNAGIDDTARRQQETAAFVRDASAAAEASATYDALRSAAQSWSLAATALASGPDVTGLRSAIDQARSACAAVPNN